MSLYLISFDLFIHDERFIPVINNYLFQYIEIIKDCLYAENESSNNFNNRYNIKEVIEDAKKILKIKFELLFEIQEGNESLVQTFINMYDNYFKYEKSNILFGEYNSSQLNLKTINKFMSFRNLNNTIIMFGTSENFWNFNYLKEIFSEGENVELIKEPYFNNTFISGKVNQNSIEALNKIFDDIPENNYYKKHKINFVRINELHANTKDNKFDYFTDNLNTQNQN